MYGPNVVECGVESWWEGAVVVLVVRGFYRQTSLRWIEVRAEQEDLRMYGDLCGRWIEQYCV